MLVTDDPTVHKESHVANELPSQSMNAIVQTAYGSPEVLECAVVDKPLVGDDEVLVRVRAASVCKGDIHLLTGTPYLVRLMGYGLLRPQHAIPGQSMAGCVEAIGKNVRSLKPGDEVYGQVPHGAFAEYVCSAAANLVPKPPKISFEQAAAIPDSGMTALQGLRDVGGLRQGQAVLINGASGGVGTFAVQIAKALGAKVTAVCSTRHVDLLRSIGADCVIDYTREDFAQRGQRYDAMLDLVGNRALADCQRVLKSKGVFISSAGSPGGDWIGPIIWLAKVMLTGVLASQKMTPFIMEPQQSDLMVLNQLVEAGAVVPVIERQYPLAQAAAAIAHVATGHAQGKTVIRM